MKLFLVFFLHFTLFEHLWRLRGSLFYRYSRDNAFAYVIQTISKAEKGNGWQQRNNIEELKKYNIDKLFGVEDRLIGGDGNRDIMCWL